MADVLEDLRRLANTDITSHQLRRYASARMLTSDAPLDVADAPARALVAGDDVALRPRGTG